MTQLMRKRTSPQQSPSKTTTDQFVRFLLANTGAAVANIFAKAISSYVMPDIISVCFGFLVGMSASYILCRIYVFQSRSKCSYAEAGRFAGVNIAALGITYGVYRQSLQVLKSLSPLSLPASAIEVAAYSLGVAAPILFSFFAQKILTFRA